VTVTKFIDLGDNPDKFDLDPGDPPLWEFKFYVISKKLRVIEA
jgi:hypothetical protein